MDYYHDDVDGYGSPSSSNFFVVVGGSSDVDDQHDSLFLLDAKREEVVVVDDDEDDEEDADDPVGDFEDADGDDNDGANARNLRVNNNSREDRTDGGKLDDPLRRSPDGEEPFDDHEGDNEAEESSEIDIDVDIDVDHVAEQQSSPLMLDSPSPPPQTQDIGSSSSRAALHPAAMAASEEETAAGTAAGAMDYADHDHCHHGILSAGRLPRPVVYVEPSAIAPDFSAVSSSLSGQVTSTSFAASGKSSPSSSSASSSSSCYFPSFSSSSAAAAVSAVSAAASTSSSCPSAMRVMVGNTGVVYDEAMMLHRNEVITTHPEDPRRISSIFNALSDAGLISRCVHVPIVPAAREDIQLVHRPEHFASMRATADMDLESLIIQADHLDSIYLNQSSFACSLLSCGGVIEICKHVSSGRLANGMAIVRPPGHHAEPETAMGFCIFNNVAVAARVLMRDGLARRVMILDWDVHHGNGVQTVFYADPNVLYISLHRHENGNFYPPGPAGDMSQIGGVGAEGRNINIPWPKGGMGDAEYMHAFHKIILPVAYEFAPDVVIVAAGFDAAQGDPIGGCTVSPAGYAHMTHALKSLANGKLILALEGGYNLKSISESAKACCEILLGKAPEAMDFLEPSPVAIETVARVIETHSPHWRCLSPHVHPDKSSLDGSKSPFVFSLSSE